jgi:hypothetical protein
MEMYQEEIECMLHRFSFKTTTTNHLMLQNDLFD